MLSAHVLSLKYHLPPEKSENDQDGDTDSFTYKYILYFTLSPHALEMSCFVFHLPKLLLKILFTQPFSIRCHPHHKFDQSPKSSRLIANSNNTFV